MDNEIIIESELEEDTAACETLLRRVIPAALEAEGVGAPCEVDVLLTNDEGIRRINLEQRDVDRATDVLSFPMFEYVPGLPPEGGRFFPARLPVDQLHRAAAPGIFCAPPAVVGRQAAGHIVGNSGVERAVGTAEDVDPIAFLPWGGLTVHPASPPPISAGAHPPHMP